MIHQYQLRLSAADGRRLPYADAYRLYAWLLEQLPEEAAEALHQQNAHLLAQSLRFDSAAGTNLWTISVFADDLAAAVQPVLSGTDEIALHETGTLRAEGAGQKTLRARDLILREDGESGRRTELRFLTPTAFKQAGRYAIYPQESLVLQSLVSSWNAVFPEMALRDPDALQAVLQGLHITDYRLRTTRFLLKGARIPGFLGSVTIDAKLSLPLKELWDALLGLAPYTGIGIKTALGMGAAEVGKP